MNVLKDAKRVLFFVLFTVSGGVLCAQTLCTNSAEFNDLLSVYSETEAIDFMKARYGQDVMPIPLPDAYYNLIPSSLGGTFREPSFGYEIKLVSKEISQINSERNHWNADASLAFFKTHTWKVSIFDGNTGDFVRHIAFSQDDFPEGSNNMDAIRWHPTDRRLLVYPRKGALRARNVFDNSDFEIVEFNLGTLGKNGRRMAGGDGNDIARPSNRLLISAVDKHTNICAYDFDNNSVVRTKLMGSPGSYYHGEEYVAIQPGKKPPTWNLPSTIDFATLSPSGKYVVALVDGQGTLLYDLNGEYLGEIYEATPHIDVAYFHVNGEMKEGVDHQTSGCQS